METHEKLPEFSLLGGPLYRLGGRLGLVQGKTNTIRLGFALGLFTWGVLALFVLLQGFGSKFFSLDAIGHHVRLLLAIPLFFLCETRVVPRMAEFLRHIIHTGIVPNSERPNLHFQIRRVARLTDAWAPEGLFLMLAFLLPLWLPIGELVGRTGNLSQIFSQAGTQHSLAYGWYQWFCLPFFRFLLLRWFWYLGLWWYFLFRLQQMKLHLIPIHPDRSAGLGHLEVVHMQFNTLVLAISAVLSASYAGEVHMGIMEFETIYHLIPLVLLLIALLFVAPFSLFTMKLRNCRFTGLDEYMTMAFRYVNTFDRKWIRNEKVSSESIMGSPDIQSLADLTNSVDVIRAMRPIPVGRGFLIKLAVWACAPFLPLFLFKYPLNQLALRLIGMLTGL